MVCLGTILNGLPIGLHDALCLFQRLGVVHERYACGESLVDAPIRKFLLARENPHECYLFLCRQFVQCIDIVQFRLAEVDTFGVRQGKEFFKKNYEAVE